MADEPTNLILEQLRLIRADVADIKRVQAKQGHTLDQHTATLREHTQTLDGLLSISPVSTGSAALRSHSSLGAKACATSRHA